MPVLHDPGGTAAAEQRARILAELSGWPDALVTTAHRVDGAPVVLGPLVDGYPRLVVIVQQPDGTYRSASHRIEDLMARGRVLSTAGDGVRYLEVPAEVLNGAELPDVPNVQRLVLLSRLLELELATGLAQVLLDEVTAHLRHRAPQWRGAPVGSIGEDPHVLRDLGLIVARTHALEQLVLDGGRLLGDWDRGSVTTAEVDDEIALARIYASEFVNEAAGEVFDLMGPSSVGLRDRRHRFWGQAQDLARRTATDTGGPL